MSLAYIESDAMWKSTVLGSVGYGVTPEAARSSAVHNLGKVDETSQVGERKITTTLRKAQKKAPRRVMNQ